MKSGDTIRISRAPLLLATLLAFGCGRARVQISAPLPHAHVQGPLLAVEARTDAAEGNLAVASAGGAPAQARVSHGRLHFDVPVAEGERVLQVSVQDSHALVAHASVPLTVDPLAGCRIDAPLDGAVIATDPGDTGLAIVPVQVSCRGLGHATTVRVVVDAWPEPLEKPMPAEGGAVSLNAELLPGPNLLSLSVPGLPLQAIHVTLQSTRCRTEILDPPDGAVLNAALDRAPAVPGEQARIVVATSCADGAPATLTITGAGGAHSVQQQVSGGVAAFDLTVPEGTIFAQAFAGSPGSAGASRRAHYQVDSLLPVATIDSPAPGAVVFSPVAFAGQATSDLFTRSAVLVLDEGAQSLDVAGARWQLAVPLSPGIHVARLVVTRMSGNQTVSPSVAFSVPAPLDAVAIVSPADGATLNLSSLVPQPGGARAVFQLHTPGRGGRTATVSCGATTSAAVPVPASGDVAVPIDLPLGCGPAALTCTASAGAATSGAVHLTVDGAAPQITLFSPPPGASSTAQASVEVKATTSCPGEPQHEQLRVNGVLASDAPAAGNALDFPAVSLQPGDNQIDLTVSDAAGNSTTQTAHVTRLIGAPVLSWIAPAAGTTLAAADDVDGDLSNGLQAQVRVAVGNRPAGTRVDLSVASVEAGGQPRLAVHAVTSAALEATFVAVTLPEGTVTLTACVTDPVSPPPAPVCISEQVQVATGRAICNVVAPADGTLLTAASDTRPDLPGYQNDLRVQTSGSGPVTVTLTDPDGVVTTPPAAPAGSGLSTVTFSSVTFGGGDGSYTIDASCGGASPGRALTNTVTLQTGGPQVSFVAPASGAVFNAASVDTSAAPGFQIDVQVQSSAGASVSLSVQCLTTSASLGPIVGDAAGEAVFAGVTLLPIDPGDESCTLTASATLGGVQGLPSQIAVTVDRTAPAPAFTAPSAGQLLQPPQIDCTNPAAPVLAAATLSLADAVPQSGLLLTVNGTPSVAVPSSTGSGWTFANVALVAGSNVLAATARDAAGNAAAAVPVQVTAQCGKTRLDFLATGPKFGWAQDKDHAAPGEQLGVQVSAASPDGAAVRICSSAGDASQPACSTAGTFPLPPAGRALAGGSVTFDATFPDGPQTVVAELVSGGAAPSDPRTILVRSTPPHVSALSIAENDSDLSLNAAELAPTLHFAVVASGAIAGQTLEIHSTALGSAVLGAAAASAGQTVVAVPLPAVAGAGGYQQHVFYALVHDDAGNPNSIPGAEYPGDPALTLGTAAQPFVIAPAPTASLQRPGSGTATLLAADDTRCSGGSCPGADPLSYLLAAQTSAPDGSQAVFLLGGAQIGTAIGLSGGSVAAPELLANGPAQALAVRITDPYGNVVTSAARSVLIDSVPPALQLTAPAIISTVPAAVTVQTGTSLEPGQTIVITADTDGVVGSAPCDASGQTQVQISLSTPGARTLIASAKDAAGNPGASSAVSTLFAPVGPTIVLSQPQPSAQRVWFGSASAAGGRCAPLLQATTSQANGSSAVLWVAPTSDCSGSPTAEQASAQVSGNQPTTFALTFADGETGFLCARVTKSGTATTSPQSFGCDLSTPTAAWSAPADNQLYVAPPLGARTALASQGSDPGTLVADFSLLVNAIAGSTVTLADGAVFASQTLPSACSGCTVSFAAAQLPVAAGGALGHTLSATVTSPGGNVGSASRTVQIDIAPPADAAPALAVTHRLGGVVNIAIASVPADDGSTGAAAQAWQVRWSLGTPLTRANWDTTGVLLASALVPAPGTPGTAQAFDVVLPADSPQVWLGVRAVDRVGNLGGFADQGATPTLSLQLARTAPVSVPILTGNASNLAGRMRVADLDGDGFDDLVISYPNDGACSGGYCDGRIYVYFGGAGGLANASSPLVLTGSIPSGLLGLGSGEGLGFDVGDFDGDGLADIAASETDCVNARVNLWTGASIRAFRQSGAALEPVVLTDGGNFLGGTVRAVGHATGGVAAGEDLLLADYTAGCGDASSLKVLPRMGAWLSGGGATLSFAQATVTLPAGHLFGTADAAAIDALEAGTTRQTLFVSFIDTDSVARELRSLPGSALTGSVALTSGNAITAPSGGGADFGRYLGAGLDATGDGKNDLALSGDKRVFLYDGSTLLAAAPQPVTTLDVNGDVIAHADVSYCAQLLPDLTGDGLAEVSGCANPGQAAEVYFAFGGSGPGFSFIDPATPGSHRRQRIAGSGAAFGQKIGAGRLSSKSGLDLAVLSESGSGAPQLWLLR